VRILLVDDHPLFRQALAVTIGELNPDAVIEEFETVQAVTGALEADATGALVLLDLQLPDNTGMLGLVKLKSRFADLPVVIVSGTDDAETVATAEACAAAGFIPKTANRRTLCAALTALLAGQRWFPEAEAARAPAQLSAVQMRVLDGIKRGLMNKQIAWELGLSEHTIKYHLAGIFRKLGCQSRAHLVSIVAERPGG
jgi:DNA-binding NarL/FixJ family response regulator